MPFLIGASRCESLALPWCRLKCLWRSIVHPIAEVWMATHYIKNPDVIELCYSSQKNLMSVLLCTHLLLRARSSVVKADRNTVLGRDGNRSCSILDLWTPPSVIAISWGPCPSNRNDSSQMIEPYWCPRKFCIIMIQHVCIMSRIQGEPRMRFQLSSPSQRGSTASGACRHTAYSAVTLGRARRVKLLNYGSFKFRSSTSLKLCSHFRVGKWLTRSQVFDTYIDHLLFRGPVISRLQMKLWYGKINHVLANHIQVSKFCYISDPPGTPS